MNNEPGQKIIAHVDRDLADIVPDFLENRQKDCKLVLDALEKGDYETIRILGHSMKGVGGGYGFDTITDLGASIEQAAKDKNKVEIHNLINKLMVYLDRVEVVYMD
ncbi:MAG: Hpt domain protein [Pelotomaculum sp. PtaB.Bin013]|uniref:Hpt domain-containing protein n=1 Tax=Pelotomaculum isophthalicicum JI TaxID=947010 RepID=A0A9X4JVU2_9FIRM|nr:Hpt domain-containing protein [Pelotomaculum isophthalicicum]MDF9408966.1 Hpt domain-containing protein [Pelotomaculum isophthalicicum JI]OPX87312.1 MAG: Hpt domain protein [Pelotomaculum sp. PtaB.Bin013]